METQERQLVMDGLASSEARLLALVEGLTPAQWSFREGPERWSIAEIVEHLILFEEFIRGAVARALEGLAEPEKMGEVGLKEHLVLGLARREMSGSMRGKWFGRRGDGRILAR